VLVPVVNGTSGNDGNARLSPDELTIYFSSDRSGSRDIFSTTRASRNDPFGTPRPVPGVNTTSDEKWPSVTADGLSMYIESTVNGPFQIFVSHRTTPAAQFSTPVLVANVNIGGTNGQTFILPDESALYFASKAETSGGTLDLFRAARGTGGQFGVPVQISTINTRTDEVGPVPTADELTIYFASGRTDSPAKGNLDIWRATRASRTANFNPPVSVEELNTSNEEVPDWLSPDLCRLYFTRNVSGNNNIYLATRSM
jgi:Tol biopolymer transport system component